MSYSVYCHPNNAKLLEDYAAKAGITLPDGIRTCEWIPEHNIEQQWQPPDEPFITYEESDYGWLKKLGFGHYVQVNKGPLFYRVKDYSIQDWIREPMQVYNYAW